MLNTVCKNMNQEPASVKEKAEFRVFPSSGESPKLLVGGKLKWKANVIVSWRWKWKGHGNLIPFRQARI